MFNKYFWIPDYPDIRDIMYSVKSPVTLTGDIDLRSICSAIENQSRIGSCGGNALAALSESLMLINKKPFFDVSRLFIYYIARRDKHNDTGIMIRDGIKAMANLGVCSEKIWPYDITKFAEQPSDEAYKEALDYKITKYARLNTKDDMLDCLLAGFPFIVGIAIYTDFESGRVAKTGFVNLPGIGERLIGGHAVVCVGYLKNSRRWLMRNSWGVDWGDQGYFTLPEEYLTNRNLSDDAWQITTEMNI